MPKRKTSSDSMAVAVVSDPKRPKNELVSFTKRRQGLFLKAAELCTLFDSQIAVLVLSPSGIPYAFGHSSVDDVLRRYDGIVGQTITAETARMIGFMSEAQRRQAREIEGLKLRARAREKEGLGRREFLAINDGDIDCRLTVGELNDLKLECLNLLNKIRKKLRNDSSSDFEVKEEISNSASSHLLPAQRNDVSFSSGFEFLLGVLDSSQPNDVSLPLGVGVERTNDASFFIGGSNFSAPDDLELLLDFDFDSMDDLKAILVDQENDMSSTAEFGVSPDLNGLISINEHDMSSMAEFGAPDPWTCPFIEEKDLTEDDMSFSIGEIQFDYMTTPTISLPV